MIDVAVQRQLGLVSVELLPPQEIWQQHLAPGLRPDVDAEDLYREYVDVHFFVPGIRVEDAWGYVRSIQKWTEWTLALRDIQVLADDSAVKKFKARDALAPSGEVFGEFRTIDAARTVDLAAGPSFEELWCTQTLQLLDGEACNGQKGTVITWTFFHHRGYEMTSAAREFWKYLSSTADLAARNLQKILAYEFA